MVSFPFDSKITGYDESNYPIYDRAVDSTLLSRVISEFVSTGVFLKESNGFSVAAGDGMTVVVSPGSAVIRGTTCIENYERTLTVQAADTNYDRIDSVILRYNNNEDVRAIDFYILQGTASSSPVQPTLTREGAIYEIAIANIYIPVNSNTISNERITDTRGDSSRCGWATGVSQDFMESLNNRFALVNQSIVDNTNKINDNTNTINNLIKYKSVLLQSDNLYDEYSNNFSGLHISSTDIDHLYNVSGYLRIPGLTNKNRLINAVVTSAYSSSASKGSNNIFIVDLRPEPNSPNGNDYMFYVEFDAFIKNFSYNSSYKITSVSMFIWYI